LHQPATAAILLEVLSKRQHRQNHICKLAEHHSLWSTEARINIKEQYMYNHASY